MIDGVCKEIAETTKIPMYLIHDGIGCLEKDIPYVIKMIKKHVKNVIGFEPKVADPRDKPDKPLRSH